MWKEQKIPNTIHETHPQWPHLTVCGAGVKNSTIGNPHKAKHPCGMCETGAKV